MFLLQCGHSKHLAPDWEQLAEAWDGDKVVLIAEMDCTSDARILCDEHRIRGYPSLKWGDPSHPTQFVDYKNDDQSFDALNRYTRENLKPVCSLNNIDICDDESRRGIEKVMEMTDKEIDELIAKEEKAAKDAEKEFGVEIGKLNAEHQQHIEEKGKKISEARAEKAKLVQAEEEFKTALKELQAKFHVAAARKNDKIDEVMNEGLGLLKAVQAHRINMEKMAKAQDEL
jgi:hypothetical protein